MSPLTAKILIVGIPFILSLAWFLFWVIRLTRTARKMKSALGITKNFDGSQRKKPQR